MKLMEAQSMDRTFPSIECVVLYFGFIVLTENSAGTLYSVEPK